ncbi:putative thiosulfate sulfur transferase [Neisseria gonorrhoeae]|uniref:Putative thiosulfate sulfur transferase n=1 Tax=Neisseria gonorrhoeae TaxID=485 RepID=A0A378VZA0_NEIGO|nr:putative thiosulfate sulfur transferase [Neisseria gonorrhoeae]
MLFRKTTAAVLAATLILNGCTMMLRGMNNPVSQTITRKHVDKDQIRAFGVVAEDNAQLEKGSLVMMGGKYWFAVNPEDSAKLTGLLKAGLDKPFQIVEDTPSYARHQALPVKFEAPGSQNFSTGGLCLRYDTDRPDDIAKLKQLEFKAVKLDNRTIYTRCVSAKGKYYATPQKLNADYHLSKVCPPIFIIRLLKNIPTNPSCLEIS